MPEENKQNMLASFGDFIKDHGIAIFLVVFFIVYIYPEQADERKDWITQITKLQESLDPAKRNITKEQTNIVLELALESFVQNIQSTMSQQGYDSSHIGRAFSTRDYFESGTTRYIVVYGQEFEVDSTMSQDQLNEELSKILLKYKRLAKREKLFVNQEAKLALEKSIRSARYVTSGLRSFRYNGESLSQIWSNAFDKFYGSFSNQIIDSFAAQREFSFERDKLISFYESLNVDVPEELRTLNELAPPSQIIFEFRENMLLEWSNKLENKAKDELRSISIVESIRERL